MNLSSNYLNEIAHPSIQTELSSVPETLDRFWYGEPLPDSVRQALVYIHRHLFDDALDAAAVRSHCQLSNHNFSSFFKHHVGIGMRQYIETGRLEAAKRLLHLNHLSILHIAWTVGYTYPESFARAFKRYTGQSASHYREEVLRKSVKKNGKEYIPFLQYIAS